MFHLHVCKAYVVNPPTATWHKPFTANVITAKRETPTGEKYCTSGFETFYDGRSAWFETSADGRPTTNRITDWKTESLLNTSNRWIGFSGEFCWIGTGGENETDANPAGTERA